MQDIARFIAGFEPFQEKYFAEERELFEQLVRGQRPKALIAACADSRVDPAHRTGAELPSKTPELQQRACEQTGVRVSLKNLVRYAWIAERFQAGTSHLRGWNFDLEAAALLHDDPVLNTFAEARSSQQAAAGVSA